MNGIEKITSRIEGDARKEAEAIAAEAAAQCEDIRKEYDQKAQDTYWTIVRAGVKECEARVQRLASTAAMESKKSILSLKQEMVASAFERAEQMLCELPEGEYVTLLAQLAAKSADTGLEELVFNAKDQSHVGPKVVKSANALLSSQGKYGKLTVSEETKDMKGGVVVKQGDIETNCSIEAMAELYRNELSTQVANVMFDN